MKFTLLTTILPLASAWTLDVWTTDDRSSAMHGTVDVDCNDIEFTPPLDINRVKFNPDTDWYPDPDTFEFYVSPGCQGLSYRNGEGDYTITPRVVQSYKVY
ncbi:hypothetical protein BGZ61DRAFT_479981 [Ilyonectria robusta]|uniref:uncharacterized protein n=1 Tax=Ilyonectria robusta TaxID=1079257 RepID=UPI001E8DD4E9|nr:uncharacterized protein BGZ61DRAFT_479981 [Ilyonectria robusta]KAH8685222.1 hypothetical protein BGZ61DRAFT_479981 [Ilyonectria robusta]